MFNKLKSNGYLLLLMVVCTFLIGGSFSYALFTTNIEKTKALNISVGTLYSDIYSTDLDSNSIILTGKEEKIITVVLINNNAVKTKINLYYSLDKENNSVSVSYLNNKILPKEGIVIEPNKSLTYELKIVNNSDVSTIILFGSDAGLSNKELLFPDNKLQIAY